ncbi:MAG: hypothetical protein MJ189_03570 [Coriobacteriales bacterium]|nr:hypothetical protein [Coriobacteriales bacterium]
MYKPKPINTKDVHLPEKLNALSEDLARNVHENWSLARIAEGWTYGKTRNDEKKQTPCLVPYDELPESEKEYDRLTAQETLKSIIKLGFEII